MTFAELPIGARFVFADSPSGPLKIKTGFERWKWAEHDSVTPIIHGCRPDREVSEGTPDDVAWYLLEALESMLNRFDCPPNTDDLLSRQVIARARAAANNYRLRATP